MRKNKKPEDPLRRKAKNNFGLDICVPSRQEIRNFICFYEPINPWINLRSLIKEPDFKIAFNSDESIYFGGTSSSKINIGILVGKKYKF